MKKQSSDFYRLYQLAFEDRFRFYRSFALSGIIFAFLFLSAFYSFDLIKNGFLLKNFLLMLFSWIFALSCFCLLGVGVTLKNLLLEIPIIALVFLLSFVYLGYPIKDWSNLVLFCLFAFICFVLAVLLFRLESNALIQLSFYRIFKRGSWFLSLLILGVFYFLISWHYSLNFEKLGDFLIDKLPLPFNYSVDEFLIKSLKGDLPFGIKIQENFGGSGLIQDLEKLNLDLNSGEISEKSFQKTEDNQAVFQQLHKQLEKFFNKSINGNENMNQLIKEYLKEVFKNNLNLPLFRFFYLVLLIIFALSLIGLINSFLGIIISLLIHVLLLPLFIRIKLTKINKKDIEKEILTI